MTVVLNPTSSVGSWGDQCSVLKGRASPSWSRLPCCQKAAKDCQIDAVVSPSIDLSLHLYSKLKLHLKPWRYSIKHICRLDTDSPQAGNFQPQAEEDGVCHADLAQGTLPVDRPSYVDELENCPHRQRP